MEQTTQRLEARISRSREQNEVMLNSLKDDQSKLQEEVRSTLTSLRGMDLKQRFGGSSSDPLGKNKSSIQIGDVVESGRPEGSTIGSGRYTEVAGQYRLGEEEINPVRNWNSGGGSSWKHKKLDLSIYSGPNPDGWILRAERYFSFYKLSEDEKLEAAVVSLDGDALLWYQWEHGCRPVRRWDELKGMQLHQFRPISSGSRYEQ